MINTITTRQPPPLGPISTNQRRSCHAHQTSNETHPTCFWLFMEFLFGPFGSLSPMLIQNAAVLNCQHLFPNNSCKTYNLSVCNYACISTVKCMGNATFDLSNLVCRDLKIFFIPVLKMKIVIHLILLY